VSSRPVDLIAPLGEYGDRGGADSARGARDQHFARAGIEVVGLERHDGEHRRESGGTHRHCLAGGQIRGQRHQPIAVDRRLLRQSAPLHLTDAPAGQHHAIALLVRRVTAFLHLTRKIDAGHVRIALHQPAGAGHDEAVLVVHR
jgi:hypothetical protein